MAQEIAAGRLDAELTVLYGSVTSADIILRAELEAVHSEKVHYVNVISGEKDYPGEKGFLTRELIARYAGPDSTFFVCGPLPMGNQQEKPQPSCGIICSGALTKFLVIPCPMPKKSPKGA